MPATTLSAMGAIVHITSARATMAKPLPFVETGPPITDALALVLPFYVFVEAGLARVATTPTHPAISRKSQKPGDNVKRIDVDVRADHDAPPTEQAQGLTVDVCLAGLSGSEIDTSSVFLVHETLDLAAPMSVDASDHSSVR